MHRQTYGLTIITNLAVSQLDLVVTLERYASHTPSYPMSIMARD